MNYQMNLTSVNDRVKRAKTLPIHEMKMLEPVIKNNVYIFEIFPTGGELYKMVLSSLKGTYIGDKIDSYYFVYDDVPLGIRDKGYFLVRDLFSKDDGGYLSLDYPHIPLYNLDTSLYLYVTVKEPIPELVLYTSVLYRLKHQSTMMMYKLYSYKVDVLNIEKGITHINILENNHIEFIAIKTDELLDKVSLYTGLDISQTEPSYYKYFIPSAENLRPQDDIYLLPLSCTPLSMNICQLILDCHNSCKISIIFIGLTYLQYNNVTRKICEIK